MSRGFQGALRSFVNLIYVYRVSLLWVGHAIASLSVLGTVFSRDPLAYVIKDFLINYEGGLTQRGFGGAIAIWLANTFGGAPAFWAWAVIFGATTAFIALVINLYRCLPDRVVYLPLILAPSGLLFFTYNFHAAFRKEVFGYLALALILTAAFSQSKRSFIGLTLAGTFCFLTSLLLHEVNLFLWAAFGLSLGLVGFARQEYRLKNMLYSLAGVSLVVGVSIFWFLELQPTPDIAAICKAAQTVDCGGPFGFLKQNLSDGVQFVQDRHHALEIAIFLAYLILSLLPFAFLRIQSPNRLKTWHILLVLGLAVSPLFIIAGDWGRWIHMIVMPMNMLGLTAIALGLAKFEPRVPTWIILAYILLWTLPPDQAKFNPSAISLVFILALLVSINWIWRRFGTKENNPL